MFVLPVGSLGQMSDGENDRTDSADADPQPKGISARNVVYALLGVVALLTLAALVAPFVIDLNGYKGEISARLKALTGRELTIAGSIDLSLLPVPVVAVNDVQLGNAAGAAVPHMVQLKAVEARVALWPLLLGAMEIEGLAFVEPVVELEILADGSTNWLFAAPEGDSVAAGAEDGVITARLGRVVVEDATVVFRDARRGLIELVENVNFEAFADSHGGPFRARGGLVARGVELAFAATVGVLAATPIAVGIDIDVPSVGASVSFAGSLSSATADAELTGDLTAKGDTLAGIVSAFAPAAAMHPLLDRPFLLAGAMSGTATGAAIDNIEIDLGGVRGTGNLRAAFGDGPQLDIALAFDRVDVDKQMADLPSDAAGRDPSDGPEGATFALPDEMNATVDLRIGSLVLNRSVVRDVRLVATFDQGLMTLQQGSALLPGGSELTAFGVLDSVDGVPRFMGQLEGSADNLRAVLDWLQVPVPAVSGDRLRAMSFATSIELTPKLIRLAALEIALDRSRLSGGISVELRRKPTFTAIISIDSIDLDSYLRPAAGNQQAAAAPAPGGGFLDALSAIEGELKAHIGSLVYRQVPVSGLVIDAAVKGGKVRLRRIVADDVAGARGTLGGLFDPATSTFNLTYGVEVADPRGLLGIVGVAAPASVANLGPLTARGRVTGDFSSVELDANVTMAGAVAKLTATVSGIAERPKFAATVDIRGDRLDQLVKRFDAKASARLGGAYSLAGKVTGDAKRSEVVFDLKALGARAKVNATLTGLADNDKMAYDSSITASHPDFTALAGIFLDGVELAWRGPGEIRVRARVAGTAAETRVSILEASVGPTRFNGTVEAHWGGERPSLKAEIAAGEIDLDMFLPAAANADFGADGTDSPAPVGRWSREPIDLSGLRAVDAKVRLAADAVKSRTRRFEAVSLSLALVDGVLEIDELGARLYGAPIKLTARLADAKPATAEIAFRVDGADLRALLMDEAGVEALSGRLDLLGKFHTQGQSAFELISALTGDAALEVRDGVIQGFDMALLNKRLGALASEADFVRLSEAALRGGKTRLHGVQGRFTAVDGVLRSTNLRVVLDGGQGRAEATVDLPRWQLALDGAISLADHPNAPLVSIAINGPIDDPKLEIRDRELRAYVVRKLLGGAVTGVTPNFRRDAGATDAALDALSGVVAPRSAPLGTSPDGAKADPKFDNVLQGIIKDLGD